MTFCADYESNVALNLLRNLLSLSLKCNLVSIGHASLNIYSKCFSLLNHFLPTTAWTNFSKNFSFTSALVAGLLHLHLHHSHLNVLCNLAWSFAGRTLFKVTTFCARSLAGLAVNITSDSVFCRSSRIQFLKWGLHCNFVVRSLSSAVSTSKIDYHYQFLTVPFVPLPLHLAGHKSDA